MSPETFVAQINTGVTILTSSPGGVTSGSGLGNDYNSDDVSYSRRHHRSYADDWDEEDDANGWRCSSWSRD